jgi:type I restriction enzyme S subunit
MNESTVQLKEAKPLPQGWRWVRLGDVSERPQYGYTASAESAKVGPKFLRISDIQNGEVDWERVPYCRCGAEATACALKPGDILFARTGGTTGKSYLVKEVPAEAIFASYLIRVRTRNDLIPEYLYLFLQSDMYWNQVMISKRGGAQPNMNATLLSNVLFPFPPLPEQKRIAAKIQEMMGEVERARLACERRLEAATALPQAYLRQVFEGEETKKWEKRRLGEVCEIIMGQSPPGDTYNRTGEGLPFFQGKLDFGEIYPTASFWCTHPQKIAEPGDVLISVRAPVGPTNLCNQKSCIGRGLAAIRSRNNGEPYFVLHFLRFIEKAISEIGQGSTFGAIKRSDLEGISFPFPSFTTQQSIANKLKDKMAGAENLKASIQKQIDGIDALPQAILRKAFSGEL